MLTVCPIYFARAIAEWYFRAIRETALACLAQCALALYLRGEGSLP